MAHSRAVASAPCRVRVREEKAKLVRRC